MVTKQVQQSIIFFLFSLASWFSVALLLFIVAFVFSKGVPVISWTFLTSFWSHLDITSGGIIQALLGTVYLGIGVIVFSLPIGVLTAIYLQEYAKDSLFTRIISLTVRNLAGVPSIVYGMFGLAFFVLLLNFGTSLLAASCTLSIMTIPWIITSTQEALKAVPFSFREGSYALGATKWQTIRRNVLPHATSGILTGSIIGVSRALGETAPIIMVGATFFMDYLPHSVFDKFMALPYHLFILATQHADPLAQTYAMGVAVVLILFIFVLNLGSFYVRYRIRSMKKW